MHIYKEKVWFACLILFLVLSVTACTGIFGPSKPPTFSDGHIFQVSNSKEWDEAIGGIKRSGNGKSYTINVKSDFTIEGKYGWGTHTFDDVQDLKVNILAETEKTLSITHLGSFLSINENQTVYMENINLVRQGYRNYYLVDVYGTFEIKNGSISKNGKPEVAGETGGAVRVNGGTVIISGNASLYEHEFGIRAWDATIIMRDNASISETRWGIYGDYKADIDMYDYSSISNNGRGLTAHPHSRVTMHDNSSVYENITYGVHISGVSLFTMKDNSAVFKNQGSNAGGVYLGSGSNFVMQDNAIISENSGGYSGGLFLPSRCTFTMKDNATISGNSSKRSGGGISTDYLYGGETYIRIMGGVIYGNNEGSLSNIAENSGASLFNGIGTVTYGRFGTEHTLLPHTDGHENYTDNTIRVINGVLQGTNK